MGENSKISWTDHTFNPWWGCTPISAGCAHCYAASFAKRTGQDCFGSSPRRFFKDAHWNEPLKWAKAARESGVRAKVFCASMADVFEDAPGLDTQRDRLSDLIHETADALDWLLLTKRPQNFSLMPPETLRLCWLGVTVEDQRAAETRIPTLLKLPARVRFLSCEPLVGDVTLHSWLEVWGVSDPSGLTTPTGIDWVIVGGESGANARVFDLGWARRIVRQCRRAGVACFVKQLGRCASDPENGLAGHGLRVPQEARALIAKRLVDRDGRDPVEWPEDLRVREFPEVSHA